MAKTARIEVRDRNPVEALQGFLRQLLEQAGISGVMVAERLPVNGAVMPALVTDPQRLEGADPLAPVFPINASKVLSRLTRKPVGEKVAAVMRPCEIRAFVELVKLKQGSLEDVTLIGVDCHGAYGNIDYRRFAGLSAPEPTLRFLENLASGRGTALDDFDISPACKACEHPVAERADLAVGLLGIDVNSAILVQANTERGEEVLDLLGLPPFDETPGRREAVADLIARRTAYRDAMFERTSAATADLERLMSYLGNCVNCYNCRVACPVCYCKECVFVTDVFDHEPSQYMRWARQKGMVKLPTDTVFFHITRLAHMSTACIGCGQCSNACPNEVPVMELFRTIAHGTQKAFDYEAGRSVDDEPPLSTFREKEFSEVTGGKD
ncbi:MAG: Coenzyme F420 hydrogenase/dehydrogenase, beta subunit C-terminal domain [Syntrophobacteraceae bacterium]|jgi:formate dehydrogenase subunit beta|nr:Coenzyme F420 hydrogenase/dehydrogenase, beta subunit C-terminal domain [Syntrophobacteraceae bacterium]